MPERGSGPDAHRVVESREARGVPKLNGADVELGNFVLGDETPGGSGWEASRALLHEIASVTPVVREPRHDGGGTSAATPAYGGGRLDCGWTARDRADAWVDPQDWGRSHLPANGGCAYIDLDHLELCIPEVLSAYDHVACWHAMLRIAQGALGAANARRPAGRRISVQVNNSDGHGQSYGSHLNFLLSRRAWDELIHRKLHHQACLAAFQVSSIVFAGQGKAGSENGAPRAAYQIAQRADFIETMTGSQTTYRRPLINTRDEPLCGPAVWDLARSPSGEAEPGAPAAAPASERLARLHVIFFDSTLCHVASLLKVGTMQIVLAMIEQGHVDPGLALDDPLAALRRWSRDPNLEATARLVSGGEVTAVELQLRFLEEARRFVDAGGCEGIVPRAAEILALWEDTLLRLRRREWPALARRLDWVLKLSLLGRALETNPELTWGSPAIKHLDHLYSSLDPDEGIYWRLEADGLLDRIVAEEEIARFTREPPADTRAWGRAMLLRRAGPGVVDAVDWDLVAFRLRDPDGRSARWRVDLPDPLRSNRAELAPAFEQAESLEDLLPALGATREEPPPPAPVVAKPWTGWLDQGRRHPGNGGEHETA